MKPQSNRQQFFQFQNTERVLNHLQIEGWTENRIAIVLKVFGPIIEFETNTDPKKLLELAEEYPTNTVAELIEKVRFNR